jgi:nickel/cobalt exporter
MGVSGGLVPCPEALGVMLIAIGLGRIGLGLALIVAFSIGLAAVLIAIGILLVRCKSRWLDRLGKPGSRWQWLLPLVSAAVVTLLGVGIVVNGLVAYAV